LLFVGVRATLVAGFADCVDLVELLLDDELPDDRLLLLLYDGVEVLGGGVYALGGGGGGVYALGGGGV
jgi:hypothetical protein